MSAPSGPMTPSVVRVAATARETPDVVTLTLDAADRSTAARPGQFNMLYAFGVGEVAISTSGDPARAGTVVHTVRAVGAVTRALCDLAPGSALGLRGPYGTPWPLPAPTGSDLLLVAGGLGLAPLRPVVYHVLARRADYRRVSLIVGARTPEDLLFRGELDRWRAARRLDVLVTVDRAGPTWRGRVGVAPALLADVAVTDRTVALVCGPEVMMRYTVRALERRGLPAARVHLSMERNMKCALGHCGRCQYREHFLCKDGPVLPYDRVGSLLWLKEA